MSSSPSRESTPHPLKAASTRECFGPVYIGGLDRSGKTTMRAFLSSHSNISIPRVGSNMWTYFYRQFGRLDRPRNLEACLAAMLRYKHVAHLDPDVARIRGEFASGAQTYAHLFSLFLKHHAERNGKPRWGAQTGLIERYAPQMFEAYHGLKVVHMVRDPRDRYAASRTLWPEGIGGSGAAVARFSYSTRLARSHVDAYGTDRYMVVRFEDMVISTEKTIRTVCSFLGEPYESAMLTMPAAPELREKLRPGGSPNDIPALSSEYIGEYRERLSHSDLAFIQLVAGKQMRRFGYESRTVATSRRTLTVRVSIDVLNRGARMAAWRTREELQQRFPRLFPRKPGNRMLTDSRHEVTS